MSDLIPESGLSDREREVLIYAAEGLTDKEIAQKLNIAVKTVTTYWDRMRLKFGATNKTQVLATALRTAYQDILSNEKRLSEFVDYMPVLFCAFNSGQGFAAFNQEWSRVTGYSREEIASPDFVQRLIPDSTVRSEVLAHWVESAGDYRDYEFEIQTKSGERRTIAWSSSAATFAMPAWRNWSLGVDVTERHEAKRVLTESRQQYMLLLKDCEEGAWLDDFDSLLSTLTPHCVEPLIKVDRSLRCHFVNEAYRDRVGDDSTGDLAIWGAAVADAVERSIEGRKRESAQATLNGESYQVEVWPQPTPAQTTRFALCIFTKMS